VPDATWSLRVFNDYNMGFKAHFPVPSCILCRMAFNVIPTWVPGKFAVGYNFSTKAPALASRAPCPLPASPLRAICMPHPVSSGPSPRAPPSASLAPPLSTAQAYIDAAVASNPGNKSYTPYYYESPDMIGPAPDFGKGFASVKPATMARESLL